MPTFQTIASQEETIQDITRRLVAFFNPVKIYLLGSVAQGESGPDSDLDFCVVVPDETPSEALRAGASQESLAGIKAASDIVPWRRTDFEQRAAWVKASLPATVVREGRILYASASNSGQVRRRLGSSRHWTI